MHNFTRLAGACSLGLAVAAFAATAHALPVTVMFHPDHGFGVEESVALAASQNFGIPIFTPPIVGEASDVLEIAFQDLDEGSIVPFPPTGPGPHTANSSWAMENVSGEDLIGETLMLFVTVDPFESIFGTIDYPDALVGLTIDADLGWLFVKLSDSEGQNFYYPTINLGSLEAGETSDIFRVRYFVNQEIHQVGVTYVLPKLRYGFGFSSTPIPEPSSLTLLGAGLAAIGLARRKRS